MAGCEDVGALLFGADLGGIGCAEVTLPATETLRQKGNVTSDNPDLVYHTWVSPLLLRCTGVQISWKVGHAWV